MAQQVGRLNWLCTKKVSGTLATACDRVPGPNRKVPDTFFVQSWLNCLYIPMAILFGLIFGPVLFARAGYAPATHDSDFYMYYFPMTEAAFEMLRAGILPLWNPYLYSGMPFLASMEIGVLYPPNWLHVLMPSERAFCLSYVFHVLLAAGGTWLYVRGRGRGPAAAVVSAMAFSFAAPTILHHDMGMTSVVYSSAWCPLIFALIDRCLRRKTTRSSCGLAVVLACQFLAGFPMFTFLLAVLIPAYLAVFGIDWHVPLGRSNRGVLLRFGGAALLALGLVAPQLLATWEYLDNSVRSELGYEQAVQCSFPASNVMTLLVPEFFGNERGCFYWGETYLFDANAFCGTTTVLLAILALLSRRNREVWFWVTATFLILAFALGKDSWFYDLCYLGVPWVNRFRGVARLAIFAVFGISVLAGIGLEEVLAGKHSIGQRRISLAVGIAAALALGGAVWQLATEAPVPLVWQDIVGRVRSEGAEIHKFIAPNDLAQFMHDSYSMMLWSAASASSTLAGVSLLVVCGARWFWLKRSRGLAIVTLLAAELYVFDANHVVLMEVEPWRSIARKMQHALSDDHDLYRVAVFSENPSFPLNRFLYSRIAEVGGHENFVLLRYSTFMHRWLDIHPQTQTYLTVPNSHRIYDVLNVKYYTTPWNAFRRRPGDELVREHLFRLERRDFALYRNRDVWPRVSLIHHAVHSPDLVSSSNLLGSLAEGDDIDIATSVEGDPGIVLEPVSELDRREEQVTIVEYTPARIVVDVHSRGAGLLLYVENYYPGWQAHVDGQVAPVLPANIFMRAVPVAKGDHRVVMEYRPGPFRFGCRIAAIAWIVVVTVASSSLRGIVRFGIPSCCRRTMPNGI